MTEVLFYHLTESTLEAALPPLLEKSVARGWKVVVQAASDERRDALDGHLRSWKDDSFLGHGLDTDPHAAEQPIILTTGTGNPNGASVRFVVEGAQPPPLDDYERGVLLFDGHDEEQLVAARAQWKVLREAGHAVTYWQQAPGGRWEKRA